MKEFFDKVMQKLEAELEVQTKESDPIRRSAIGATAARSAILSLYEDEAFMEEYRNRELPSFIKANKEFFPRLLAHFLFYDLRYKIEISRCYSSKESHILNCWRIMKQFHQFFMSQQDLVMYYYAGRTERDIQIFLKGNVKSSKMAKSLAKLHKNRGVQEVAILLVADLIRPLLRAELDAAENEEESSMRLKMPLFTTN